MFVSEIVLSQLQIDDFFNGFPLHGFQHTNVGLVPFSKTKNKQKQMLYSPKQQ